MDSRKANTGSMQTPVFRRLPGQLRAARQAANLSQKALALAADVDQSRLCALEKGRHVLTDVHLEERLLVALGCSGRALVLIKRAASHDRAMLALESQALDQRALQVASAGLWTAWHLNDDEQTGLVEQLNEICRSKVVLDALLRCYRPPGMEARP
jgi:transcriptional regulator with XRE-family HTH domain